jgi:hypothetical protein
MRSSEQLAQDIQDCIYEIRGTLKYYYYDTPEEKIIRDFCKKYNVDFDHICRVAEWDLQPPPDRIVKIEHGFLFTSHSKLLSRKEINTKIEGDVITVGRKIQGEKRKIRDYSTLGARAIFFPMETKVDGVIVPKYTGSSIAFSIKEDFMIN